MRDEGVIYVAGHPLLNRRCTRLPGCIRLWNDLYGVEWGVKLYSLTHYLWVDLRRVTAIDGSHFGEHFFENHCICNHARKVARVRVWRRGSERCDNRVQHVKPWSNGLWCTLTLNSENRVAITPGSELRTPTYPTQFVRNSSIFCRDLNAFACSFHTLFCYSDERQNGKFSEASRY